MVAVNYFKIDELLRVRGLSRRKLALAASINPGSFAGSFRRNSRIRIDSLWRIADALSVPATSLVDRSGYATDEAYNADLQAVKNGRPAFVGMVEDADILDGIRLLRGLNADGIAEALHLLAMLNEIPKYQKTDAELSAMQDAEYLWYERQERMSEIEAEREALSYDSPF